MVCTTRQMFTIVFVSCLYVFPDVYGRYYCSMYYSSNTKHNFLRSLGNHSSDAREKKRNSTERKKKKKTVVVFVSLIFLYSDKILMHRPGSRERLRNRVRPERRRKQPPGRERFSFFRIPADRKRNCEHTFRTKVKLKRKSRSTWHHASRCAVGCRALSTRRSFHCQEFGIILDMFVSCDGQTSHERVH